MATFITSVFTKKVEAELGALGFKDYPFIEIPHPFANRTDQWITERAGLVVEQVVDLLTKK